MPYIFVKLAKKTFHISYFLISWIFFKNVNNNIQWDKKANNVLLGVILCLYFTSSDHEMQ